MKKHHKVIAMTLALIALLWFMLSYATQVVFNIAINEPHTK
ncbi:hypothetical protein [Pedobacter punctiformis]|uniref:Uncharacterized protein n=1 Tax=Pedobacter punctiformis TaxID=3004097 RepID=A0ABT4L919_9SPHI|nr:hypothetical protein [Pedobacter sp. HCMS5-2]MCZ4244331.1 hypothetical protein [Pedobacter sp. HCMS5-2]